MHQESRAVAVLCGCGVVVLVGLFIVVLRLSHGTGVAALPAVPRELPAPTPANVPAPSVANQAPRIMGSPTMSKAQIAFEYAGEIYGPKVMIANEMAGSGGDALPWLFKRAQIGPLVGTRTWGGLVGIGGYPKLIDGGRITAPRWGLYSAEGKYEVENIGVSPDLEVEQDPEQVRAGHDPQLEKAVQLALDGLAKAPFVRPKRPPFPHYGPRLPKP